MKKLLIPLGLITGLNSLFAGRIHDAVIYGDLAAVQTEIDHGVEVDLKNDVGLTPLHISTFFGQFEIAKLLINNGANINETFFQKHHLQSAAGIDRGDFIDGINKESKGYATTSLHYALKFKKTRLVELLLANEADFSLLVDNNISINAIDRFGYSYLHRSVLWNHNSVVKYFIDEKANVNIEDTNGDTPLHIAVNYGNKDIIKTLMQAGADPAIQNGHGINSYEKAIGEKDILDILNLYNLNEPQVDHVNSEVESLIEPDLPSLIIDHQPDIEDPVDLFEAIYVNNIEALTIMLDDGENIHEISYLEKSYGLSPISYACKLGRSEIIDLLIERGGIKTLFEAIQANKIEAVINILNNGGNINERIKEENGGMILFFGTGMYSGDTITPINYASQLGRFEIVELLINKGAILDGDFYHNKEFEPDVNTLSKDLTIFRLGWLHSVKSPLFLAAKFNQKNVVQLLLSAGAKVNKAFYCGYSILTPVDIAELMGNVGIVNILHKYNGKRSIEIDISMAVQNGSYPWLKKHISNGQNVNSTILRMTLLDYAIAYGFYDIALYLIANGADVNSEGILGMTPLHYAALKGNEVIIDKLIGNAGKVNAVNHRGFSPLHLLLYNIHNHWHGFGYNEPGNLRPSKSTIFQIMKLLINQGADVNERGNPMDEYYKEKHTFLGGTFTTDGASKNYSIPASIQKGETPLDIVYTTLSGLIEDKSDCFWYLKLYGGVTGEKLDEISESIILASKFGHIEAIKILIENGQDVNIIDENGMTALHYAIQGVQFSIAEFLISNGANVNATNKDGQTPLDIMGFRYYNLLRLHGAKTSQELAILRSPNLIYSKDKFSINIPFSFSFLSLINKDYIIEVSDDLKQWAQLQEVKGTGSEVKVTDWREAVFKKQYYRIKVLE